MMISHSHKFIFIHIQKTAGTSIRRVLWPYQPLGAKVRYRIFEACKWAYVRAFTPPLPDPDASPNANCDFVRPRFDGTIKTLKNALWYRGLHWHCTALMVRERLPEIFDQYFKFAFVRNPWDLCVSYYFFALNKPWHFMHNVAKSGGFEGFLDFIISRKMRWHQKNFVTGPDGRIIVDFIGRVENLAEDFQSVCERIGIPYSLVHDNRSPERAADYRKYYNDRTARLVEEYFRDDIEMFGYKF